MLKPQLAGPLNPHILTLCIHEMASAFFNRQRQLYFPAALNFLQAHITLFHYLPVPSYELITQIKRVAFEWNAFPVEVTGVVSLGKGVAYKLESTALHQLHIQFQRLWKPLLKPQDLQRLWPHITIQNKVTPQQAKDLLTHLKKDFQPFSFDAQGLSLWEYLGGPWRLVDTISFSSTTHL